MKKLILFSVLLIAVYVFFREGLVEQQSSAPETGLEDLSREEKVRALDELKVLYPKKDSMKLEVAPKREDAPFFKGELEDYERLEKVQYLDERGNPVNLEDEEGEP